MSTGSNANVSIDANESFWDVPNAIACGILQNDGKMQVEKNTDAADLLQAALVEETSNGSTNNADPSPRQHRKGWRKPIGMPKRPMSSYNLFFQLERERLVNGEEDRVYTSADIDRIAKIQKQKDVTCHKRKHRKSHGKISFATLARVIADKWKALDDSSKVAFFERAALEKNEYKAAVDEWARSSKDPTQLDSSSPTPQFLTEPIESPPGEKEDLSTMLQHKSFTSPSFAFPTQEEVSQQELWNAANSGAPIDQMMMNINAMDSSYIEQTSLNVNRDMGLNNGFPRTVVDRSRMFRVSPPAVRRQLQPRYALSSSGEYFEPDRMFAMRDTPPNSSFHFNQSNFSPSGVVDDIYGQDIPPPSFTKYNISPNHDDFDESDLDSLHHHHLKMMRRRSFAMGDRRSFNEAMFRQQEQLELRRLQFRSGRHIQSVPNLYYSPTEYNNLQELAGIPLESLYDVNPGRFVPPSMLPGVPNMRKMQSRIARRSTFSGGYSMDNSDRQDVMNSPRYHPVRVSAMQNLQIPQPDQLSDKNSVMTEKDEDFPPPIDVITIRRAPQKQESAAYHEHEFVNEANSYSQLSSSQTSSYRQQQQQYDNDALLGSYIRKQHFAARSNHPYLSEDEERAAIDLASLAGMKTSADEPISKEIFHHPSELHHHHNSPHPHMDDRNSSGSHDTPIGLPLNCGEDTSYHGKTWEV